MSRLRRSIYCCVFLGALSVVASLGNDAMAQARRKGKGRTVAPAKVVIDVPQVEEQFRAQYLGYDLEAAHKSLDALLKHSPSDSTYAIYREQLSRAERMLGKVEPIQLLCTDEFAWAELDAKLKLYSPTLAKQLAFVEQDGKVSSEQRLSFGGYQLILKTSSEQGDLERVEHFEGSESEVKPLSSALNTPGAREAFPFLMSDGIRLIFASDKTSDGIGGYDLYMSRYSSRQTDFLEPLPLPLPFNSPSNDYLFAYDEELNQSFLLSDRGASEDKIRLFVFEGLPVSISGGAMAGDVERPREEALQLAKLEQAALLANAPSAIPSLEDEPCYLALDGNHAVSGWSDFRSAEAMELYRRYRKQEEHLQSLMTQQSKLRQALKTGKEQSKVELMALEEAIQKIQASQERSLVEIKNKEINARKQE